MKHQLLVWNDDQSTGIPLIDEHHRSIIAVMNSLFFFMRKDEGDKVLLPLVIIIEQYIKIHFMMEENMLRESKFSAVDEHILHHSLIEKKMLVLASKLRHTGRPEELLDFLKIWWKEHIEVHDQIFSRHFEEYREKKAQM